MGIQVNHDHCFAYLGLAKSVNEKMDVKVKRSQKSGPMSKSALLLGPNGRASFGPTSSESHRLFTLTPGTPRSNNACEINSNPER